MRILQDFPKDALGNDITYIGITFLHPRPGLERLSAYIAATFLSGPYDQNCFTLNLGERDLLTILQEFKLHPLPYIQRAFLWLGTAKQRRGVVPGLRYFVE